MKIYTYILTSSLFMLNSCVMPAKYMELKKRSETYDSDVQKRDQEISKLDSISRIQVDAIIKLTQDTIRLSNKYNILNNKYSNNVSGGTSDAARLTRQIDNSQRELMSLRRDIDKYEREIKNKEFAFNDFRDLVYGFLMSFSSEGIKMVPNGENIKLIVDDALLFEPGGYLLTVESGDLVSYIASFLGRNKNITTTIVANTDRSDSTLNEGINDCWELSAKRSTEIAREILKNEYVSPSRIIISGRSSSNPVTEETNELSKSKNRRTEFILSRENYYE